MEKTKVVVAQPRSKSLRATIPAGIVRQFGIEEGWELEWDIRARDNELQIVVQPIPPRETAEPKAMPRRRGKKGDPA